MLTEVKNGLAALVLLGLAFPTAAQAQVPSAQGSVALNATLDEFIEMTASRHEPVSVGSNSRRPPRQKSTR